MNLIVDDHADTRALFTLVLEAEGYISTAVESGAEAFVLMQTNVPELVILDQAMPDMDGMKLIRLMKCTPRLHNVPIIGVSGHGAAIGRVMKAVGADRFFEKGTIDWERFAAEIRSLLAQRQGNGAAA